MDEDQEFTEELFRFMAEEAAHRDDWREDCLSTLELAEVVHQKTDDARLVSLSFHVTSCRYCQDRRQRLLKATTSETLDRLIDALEDGPDQRENHALADELMKYALDRLSPARKAVITRHVLTCCRCERRLADKQRLANVAEASGLEKAMQCPWLANESA